MRQGPAQVGKILTEEDRLIEMIVDKCMTIFQELMADV